MKKSWMKSKSPSPDSRRSTPKNRFFLPFANLRGKRPCAAILPLAVLLSACYVPPGSSRFEVTEPSQTIAEQPQGVTRTLSLQTPTPAWQLVPLMLYRTGENDYLCIHTLTPPDGMVAQMLSSTTNTITFRHTGQSEPATKHYVLGKTWKWNGNPEITFIESLDEIKDALADAQSVPFTTD